MDRIVEMDRIAEIASLAIQVLTVPTPTGFQPEAIVGHAGMGESWRIREPIVEFEASDSAKFLLMAGLCVKEKCYEKLTLESLSKPPYNLRRTEGVFAQPNALHTKDQADWIIDRVNELKISRIVFMSSSYHLVRAYLTLLKSWLQLGLHPVVMIPKPIAMSSAIILPENGESARAMISGEMRRILEYQQKGDVATLAELEAYIDHII
jgi:hypothetical protein